MFLEYWCTARVFSRDVGTVNFPFRDFPISGKLCRDPGKLLTFKRYCAEVVLIINVNLFKLKHHCGENGLVKRKLRSSHYSLDSGLIKFTMAMGLFQ